MQKTIDILIPAYNAAINIRNCVQSIVLQTDFEEIANQIIVVNDGSKDDTIEILNAMPIPKLQVISHSQNKGRSAAINTAYNHATAPFLIILDSDCIVFGKDWLKTYHHCATSNQKKIVFGTTRASGNKFWDKYTNHVAERRLRNQSITEQAMTNILISRQLMAETGGFSESFTHYGFEDKDLLLSLSKITNESEIEYRHDLIVQHSTIGMSTSILCKKLEESGQYTSSVFRNRNPLEYREMTYSKFDANTISDISKWFLFKLCLTKELLVYVTENLTKINTMPFAVTLIMVRICMMLSYFKGSTKTKQSTAQNS